MRFLPAWRHAIWWEVFCSKATLFYVSATVALMIYLFGQVACWHDSYVWATYGKFFFEPLSRLDVVNRDPAYPFLIWLTGYEKTHSMQGILFLQAVMGALCPVLVCLTLEKISPRLGLAAGWIALLSGIPFVFQTQIFTDQMHMFLLLLLALAGAACCMTHRIAGLYGVPVVAGLLSFCRPTFWMLLPLAVLVVVLWGCFRRRAGMPCVAHCGVALLLLATLFATNCWVRDWPYRALQEQHRPAVYSRGAGFQSLFNIYRYAGGIQGVLSPEDGPATREFRLKMIAAFERCGSPLRGYAGCLDPYVRQKLRVSGQLAHDTQSAAAALETYFYYPRYVAYWFMDPVAQAYGQSPEGQMRFARLYFEQMTSHPLMAVHMLATAFSELVFASYYSYSENDDFGYENYNFDGRRVPSIPFLPVQRVQNCGFQPDFAQYASFRYISQPFSEAVQALFEKVFRIIAISSGVLFILGAAVYARMLRKREDRAVMREAAFFFFLFLVYWLPNGLMMMVVSIQFRYHICTALLPLMGAAILLRRLWISLYGFAAGMRHCTFTT